LSILADGVAAVDEVAVGGDQWALVPLGTAMLTLDCSSIASRLGRLRLD